MRIDQRRGEGRSGRSGGGTEVLSSAQLLESRDQEIAWRLGEGFDTVGQFEQV